MWEIFISWTSGEHTLKHITSNCTTDVLDYLIENGLSMTAATEKAIALDALQRGWRDTTDGENRFFVELDDKGSFASVFKINRRHLIMDLLRQDLGCISANEDITTEDRREIFTSILLGSSDVTKELLDEVISDYEINNLIVTNTMSIDSIAATKCIMDNFNFVFKLVQFGLDGTITQQYELIAKSKEMAHNISIDFYNGNYLTGKWYMLANGEILGSVR